MCVRAGARAQNSWSEMRGAPYVRQVRLADPSKDTGRSAALRRGKQGGLDCGNAGVKIACAERGAGDAEEHVVVAEVAFVRVSR